MKPLKLTIEGINSFTEPREIDFERLSRDGIFCICGPTGSGKTTILDSMILALYGENKNRGNLSDYVNTKCEKGRITFEFELGSSRYRLIREIRRKPGSKASLTKIDTGEVIADQADKVTEEIKKALKLDKEEFTKVVVLEQGKFAQFMQMTGKDRSKTVSKLFSLERFEKLKETLSAAKNKYDKLIGEAEAALRQYEDVTEEKYADKLRESKRLAKELAAKNKECAEMEKDIKAAELLRANAQRRADAKSAADSAQSELAAIADAKNKIAANRAALDADKAKLGELKTASEAARVTLAKADECSRDEELKKKKENERKELRDKYRASDAKIKSIIDETETLKTEKENNMSIVASIMRDVNMLGYEVKEPSEAAFAELKATAEADCARLKDAEKKRAEAKKNFDTFTALAEKLMSGESELKRKCETLVAQADKAKKEYENARIESEAVAVRASLKNGDVCPVCGGEYHGYHKDADAATRNLAALKAKSDEAAKNSEQAASEYKDVLGSQSINAEKLKDAEKNLVECEKMLSGKSAANANKVAEFAKRGAAAAKYVAETERKFTELDGKLTVEKSDAEKIISDGNRLGAEIDELTRKIEERLGGKSVDTAKAEANTAVQSYAVAYESYEARAEALTKTETELAARESAAKTKLDENKKTLVLLPEAAFDEAEFGQRNEALTLIKADIAELGAKIGGLDSEAKLMRERLDKKKECSAQKNKLGKIRDCVLELNECTKGENRLLSFVAEEYVQSFTAAASDTLGKLTNGKYTLVYDDGDFYVQDFFADNARRKVKTLSGGETFLASVSIAMAISREIAANQNYEFFFLDEGFGTLDERAIETVTEALIALSRDTAVGLITHRGELAERIGARLNVTPATEDEGSNIVFVGV